MPLSHNSFYQNNGKPNRALPANLILTWSSWPETFGSTINRTTNHYFDPKTNQNKVNKPKQIKLRETQKPKKNKENRSNTKKIKNTMNILLEPRKYELKNKLDIANLGAQRG